MFDSPSNEESKLDQQAEESSASENQDLETSENSSNSGESETELSTFDLVKNAIEKTEGEDDDNTEGNSEDDESEGKDKSESEDDDESKSEGDETDDPTDEELKAWKPKTRKRFEQLQAKYRDVNERLEKAEVDVGWKANFDGFLKTNNMSSEEANTLFDIGAMMKNDPKKALEALTPYYNQLLEVTGQILSPELKHKVKQGFITEQDAQDLSRQRATTRNYEARDKNNDTQRLQDEADQQKTLAVDIQAALANLEKSWQSSDLDYKLKSTRVRDRVKLAWFEANSAGQMPKTVEQAIRMAERAKKEVEKDFRNLRPRKPVHTVDGAGQGHSRPEPKNTLDVIKQTLGA